MSSTQNFFRSKQVRDLIQTKPMLKGMGKLTFEYIRDAVVKVQGQEPPYNPYLYEPLFSDAGKLLDRCLAYRKEAFDLESQAVRRALEYQLFKEVKTDEEALNAQLTDTSALKVGAAGQRAAASEFRKGTSADFHPFGTAADAGASASEAAAENQVLRLQTLNSRLEKLANHQDLLESRHTTPGHSLNFMQRRERVLALLQQDVGEVFLKLRAARAGVALQLGLGDNPDYPFPKVQNDESDVSFLDQLVLWLRDMLRRYELDTADDIILERVIPLVQPFNATERLVEKKDFTAAVSTATNGDFAIPSLAKVIPAALKRVRVRGVAVSAGWRDLDRESRGAAFSWSGLVFFPGQPSPYAASPEGASKEFARSPAVLGRIGVFRSDASPTFIAGEEVWNQDPLAGEIRVLIHPYVVSGSQEVEAVRGYVPTNAQLVDFKLHLKIAATPDQDPGNWRKNF